MRFHERKDRLTGTTLGSGVSDAGLAFKVLPRRDVRQACAMLTVDYGSVDNGFVPPGAARAVQVPAGIAHFLEHKMFEKERGDLMTEFSRLGASSNAFTSHTTTTYVFTATEHVERCLDLLMELVFKTHFTKELVEKEQGIIAQEIRGGEDQVGWKTYRHAIRGLFRRHPVREEITGTVGSIARITAAALQRCHEAFYVPSNMVFCAAGRITTRDVVNAIDRQLGKTRVKRKAARRSIVAEPVGVARKAASFRMPVSMPRLLIGFKGPVSGLSRTDEAWLETAGDFFLDCVLGSSTEFHERLYRSGLIQDDFSWSVHAAAGVVYALAGGNTPDPAALAARLRSEIERVLTRGRIGSELDRLRKDALGGYLRTLDVAGSACWQLVESHWSGVGIFDTPDLIARCTEASVVEVARRIFAKNRQTVVTLLPSS